MVFALGAGKYFDIENAEEYEETIVAKCVDTYISLCALHNPPKPASSIDRTSSEFGDGMSSSNANGAANLNLGVGSPTTPFTQSHLPSKSLLSRDEETTWDASAPGGGNAGVPGAHPHPLTLSNATKKSLQSVIRRIFRSCYEVGAYKQVVGIAVEARNMDIMREAILQATQDEKGHGKKTVVASPSQTEELIEYVLDICLNVVQERGLRNRILKLVLGLLNDISNPDYFAIA